MSKSIYSIYLLLLGITLHPLHLSGKQSHNADNWIDQCQIAITNTDFSTAKALSDSILQKGKDLDDNRLIAYGMSLGANAAVLAGRGEEAPKKLHEANKISEKIHNDSIRALALNGLGVYEATVNANYYVAHRYFMNALEAANSSQYELLRIRSLNNLTQLGLHENDSIFMKYAREAYDAAYKYGELKPLYVATVHLASGYINYLNDFKSAERYLIEAENIAPKIKGDKTPLKVLRATLLTKSGHSKEALEILQEAEGSFTNSAEQASALPEIYYVRACALYNLGEYPKAISALQQCIALSKQLHVEPLHIKSLRLLWECYEKTGNYSGAVGAMKQYMTLHDSLFSAEKEHTVRELDIIYNVGKLEQEAVEQEARYRLANQRAWLLGLSAVLLLLIVIGLIRMIRHKSKLYGKLVTQYQKLVEEEYKLRNPDPTQIIEEGLKEIEDTDLSQNNEDINEEEAIGTSVCANSEKIWADLCKVMDSEKLYTDSDISRETVARKINTNRTYLTKIISTKTGMTYPQFINHYRINEAIRILSDRSREDYPIKALASDLGFSSISTFYSVFKARTGLTPKEFRANTKK